MKNQWKSVELFLALGTVATIGLFSGRVVNASEYNNNIQEESTSLNAQIMPDYGCTIHHKGTHDQGGESGDEQGSETVSHNEGGKGK